MDRKTFEQEAQCTWEPEYKGFISDEHLTIGCLQRIGSALEGIEEQLAKIVEAGPALKDAIIQELQKQAVARKEWGRV